MKWFMEKLRTNDAFAWGFAIAGCILMFIIAFVL